MNERLDYAAVRAAVPEAPPLLMLDRVEIGAEGTSAVGLKAITNGEEFFVGHFPGAPITPGVLQVAAMAQLSGLLVSRRCPGAGVPVLKGLKRIKFRKPVFPGDSMRIETELVGEDAGRFTFKARTVVAGQATCQGELTVAMEDRTDDRTAPIPEGDLPRWPTEGTPVESSGIMQTIPHRFPFLFVDKVQYRLTGVDEGDVFGIKNVTGGEPFVAANPGAFLPEAILVEAAAQVECAFALTLERNVGKLGYFMSIDEATFHAPIRAGDTVVFNMDIKQRGMFGVGGGTAYVGETPVAEVAMKFAIVDREGTGD